VSGVRLGYKQTEVGTIPEQWLVETIDNMVQTSAPVRYGIVQVGPHVDAGVPTIAIKHVKAIATAPLHRTSPIRELPYARSRVRSEDVLISIKGTVGRVGIVPSGFEGNISRDLARLRLTEGYSPAYVAYQFESDRTQERISRAIVGTTRLELSIATLRRFKLAIPPTNAEQLAIAAALCHGDLLLDALDQLIAKKREIKQGAMQELLSGVRRLPGFQEGWADVKLGTVVAIRNEKVQTRGNPAAKFCVELEQVLSGTGSLERLEDASGRVSIKYRFQPRDVLFGRLRPYLRKYWMADREGVCSTEIWPLFAPRGQVDPAFLFYIVQTDGFINVAGAAYGTHMPRADWKMVSDFVVKLPPTPNEQSAIAAVLSDIDGEIFALEVKLAKARAVKQAMMQVLLTGEVRLV
jgi:type I restriction enzyme, S subunit